MARRKPGAGRRFGGWLLLAGGVAAAFVGFRWTSGIGDRGGALAPSSVLEAPPDAVPSAAPAAALDAAVAPEPDAVSPTPTSTAPGLAARAPGEAPPPRAATREEITDEDRRALEEVLDRSVKKSRKP